MKHSNLLIAALIFGLAIQAVNTIDCQAGKFDNGVSCQDCPDNQFSSGNQTSCQECTNCTQCDATTGSCTQCPAGQEVDNTNGTCSDCAPLTFSLGVQCQDCNDTCLTCNSSNGNCLSCNNGSGLSSDRCQDCLSNQFTNTTTYACESCDSNCSTCSGTSTTCTSCTTGFTVFEGVCVDNCGIANCANCTDNVCHQCTTNYILLGSSCIASCSLQQNCTSCAVGSFAQCAACDTGLTLSSDKTQCVTCTVTNCMSCISDNYCAVCMNDLFPANGLCFSCQVDNCFACSADNTCSNCHDGYKTNPSPTGTDDQCISCLDPCQTCYSDGDCKLCELPYSQMELLPDNQCFLCSDPRCMICTDSGANSCTACNSLYVLTSNGTCQASCSYGCTTCSTTDNTTTCTACFHVYFNLENGTCVQCTNSPICQTCTNGFATCTQCATGYYLKDGACMACAAYCATCDSTNPDYCTTLRDPYGNTLIDTGLLYSITNTSNYPAACDPECVTCSSAYPSICLTCYYGFYLNQWNFCSPCTYASQCATCVSDTPAQCLTCFSGSFLDETTNTCTMCTFPCIACNNATATSCSACVQGYVLMTDNTCQLESTFEEDFGSAPVPNCAMQRFGTNSSGQNVVICELCDQGYTQTTDGCVPCSLGCQVCSSEDLLVCISCKAGYYLNSSNICVPCHDHCLVCNSTYCFNCQQNYVVNMNFECQKQCLTPCATCSVDNPLTCLTCLAGYTMVNGACSNNLTCNSDSTCLTCPYGYSILKNNNDTQLSMTCTQCDQSSRCARCNTSNTAQCYGCDIGLYLNDNNICVACAEGCSICISLAMCAYCIDGYVPVQAGAIRGNDAPILVNCTKCVSPCSNCVGSPSTCTSCVNGFTLTGSVCLSNFKFVVRVVLNATLAQFQANYFNFVTAIANQAGVAFSDIVITSITSGSIIIDMDISSNNPSGSNQANTVQNNINNLLATGTIANMQVTSFTVATDGATNNDDDGGLSRTTIIILATVIPIGTLLIVGIIVIIYCVHKRRKEQEAGMNEWNSAGGNTTGRNIELTTNQTKRAYL